MPHPRGMGASHRNGSSQSTEASSIAAAATEGQALANVFLAPAYDELISQGIPLDLEPWTQEVIGAPLQAPVTAGGGVSMSEGGSGEDLGASSGSRKRYTAEEIRRRRADRQSEYRKRRQSETQVTEESLQMAANQVVAAREEQNALQMQASVLQKMGNYTEGVLQTIRGLPGVAQDALSQLEPVYQLTTTLFRLMLVKAVVPTDNQIRMVIKNHSIEELESKVMEGQLQIADMVQTWETRPSSRSMIEAHLGFLQDVRRRSAVILAEERPYVALELIQRRAVPLGADGRPNQILREALTAVKMSPEQIEAVRQQWNIYRQDILHSRKVAIEAVWAAVGVCPQQGEGLENYSASAAAGRFLETMDTVTTLKKYPVEEALSLLNLVVVWSDTLTPLQRGRMAGACGQYLPDPLQLCSIMFEEDTPALET